MQKQEEYLTMEQYREAFKQMRVRVDLLVKDHKPAEIFQKSIFELASEAGLCYIRNRDANKQDYQEKVNIFLNFDEYLKGVKREYLLTIGLKTSSCTFHHDKKYSPRDSNSPRDKNSPRDTLHFN